MGILVCKVWCNKNQSKYNSDYFEFIASDVTWPTSPYNCDLYSSSGSNDTAKAEQFCSNYEPGSQKWRIFISSLLRGAFINYVDIFLDFFDHLPSNIDISYLLNIDKNWHFWPTYPPLIVNVNIVCEWPLTTYFVHC